MYFLAKELFFIIEKGKKLKNKLFFFLRKFMYLNNLLERINTFFKENVAQMKKIIQLNTIPKINPIKVHFIILFQYNDLFKRIRKNNK